MEEGPRGGGSILVNAVGWKPTEWGSIPLRRRRGLEEVVAPVVETVDTAIFKTTACTGMSVRVRPGAPHPSIIVEFSFRAVNHGWYASCLYCGGSVSVCQWVTGH